MGNHSVAEAKNRLSELIERALKGESVVITKHGTPVIEFRPVEKPPQPVTKADMEWLRAHRVKRRAETIDSATLIRTMRDESDP
jgi:prevent-host-death family protein